MKIKLLSLSIRHFKGIRNLDISFTDRTIISGDNGTGKTTVADSIIWLLFGKNTADEKDFNIKPLGYELHPECTDVTGVFDADGLHMKFTRQLKEKWTKKKGSETAEFTGNVSEYYYNDVPVSATDFKAKIDGIISEDIFKLITSPMQFNRMNWKDRRNILSKMAGEITDLEIAGDSEDFKNLLQSISGITFSEFKKRITAQKKKLKDDLLLVPAKISEVNKMIVPDPNYSELEESKRLAIETLNKTESQIEDSQLAVKEQAEIVNQKRIEKSKLEGLLDEAKQKANKVKFESINLINSSISKNDNELLSIKRTIETLEKTYKFNREKLNDLAEENIALRQKIKQIDAELITFKESDCICPTCKRELDNLEQKKIELLENFNQDKAKRIADINKRGISNKELIEKLTADNKEIEVNIALEKSKITDLNKIMEVLFSDKAKIENQPAPITDNMIDLQKQVDNFIIPEIKPVDISELKEKKSQAHDLIESINKELLIKDQNEKAKNRIKELESQESIWSSELAQLERQEFIEAQFQKKKINEIERRINDKFSYVRWKMYEDQINGGETETCECMVNSVPYSDLNTASKINAGIDIINALSNHYEISAPVIVDNAESINELLLTSGQLICLKVSYDKELTIKN